MHNASSRTITSPLCPLETRVKGLPESIHSPAGFQYYYLCKLRYPPLNTKYKPPAVQNLDCFGYFNRVSLAQVKASKSPGIFECLWVYTITKTPGNRAGACYSVYCVQYSLSREKRAAHLFHTARLVFLGTNTGMPSRRAHVRVSRTKSPTRTAMRPIKVVPKKSPLYGRTAGHQKN